MVPWMMMHMLLLMIAHKMRSFALGMNGHTGSRHNAQRKC